jgi:TonB family protein
MRHCRSAFVSVAALLAPLAIFSVANAEPQLQPGDHANVGASAAAPPPGSSADTDSSPTDEATKAAVLTRAPTLIKFASAAFPQTAPEEQTEARVVLELLLTETGLVADVRVVQSAGADFDAAASEAARQFEFSPAHVDDVPTSIRIQYAYDFHREAATKPVTVFNGVVKDRTSGSPLPNIAVRLDTGERTATDSAGRFEFGEVSPGEHTVLLSGPGVAALQTTETVVEGKILSVSYDISIQIIAADDTLAQDVDDLELLVVAPKIAADVVATRVEAESARRVAGTQGDVLKVVENMPGVARASVGSGDVVVWGAAPNDTRVYVDSVRVPALYHFGGFRSVVHSDLVKAVELIPGAYGASYGRGLGGLVTVSTQDPTQHNLRGSVQVDVLDASASLGATSGKLGVAIGGRRSHLHQVFSGALDDNTQQYFAIPKYYDASARGRYQMDSQSWVELGGLVSSDQITRTVQSSDPNAQRSETRDLNFERGWVRYQTEDDAGTRVTFVPWFGHDRTGLDGKFGIIPVEQSGNSFLYGLRGNWAGQATEFVTAQLGMDLELVQSEYSRVGSTSSPAREGDSRIFGQPPADQINIDNWKVTTGSVAPYAEADISLLDDQLHLVPGLRLEPYFASVNRRRPSEGGPQIGAFDADLSVQPRFSIRHRFGERLLVKAAWGKYRQPAPAEDLSSVFGNPTLGTAQATHYLFGVEAELGQLLHVETAAFLSTSENLAVRNPLASPRVAEALVANGEGRSYGMQVMVRRNLGSGFFGWLAYTVLRSERRLTPDHPWRLFDFDQTHVLTALASYDVGAGFELGARARLSSGYPRTPVVGSYYDARRDQFEPILGAQNSDRIPYFLQFDVRASKRWKWQHQELEAYLDVLNTTNRSNPEEVVYNSTYSDKRFINGLPLLPVLGLKWSYQ